MATPRSLGTRLDSPDRYMIAWIAALPIERAAAIALLDERHEEPHGFSQHPGDDNSYTWGRIGKHNLVIASLAAGVCGTTSAANTASALISSLPKIRIGLLVGIAGAISRPEKGTLKDIRLGDVVVSQPDGDTGGVVQYDLVKARVNNKRKRKDFLCMPPPVLLHALANLQAMHVVDGHGLTEFLETIQVPLKRLKPSASAPEHQGFENDRLFKASYEHTEGPDCRNCDPNQQVPREVRDSTEPRIHYGTIASGNTLVKDAATRDAIVEHVGDECLCVEMEAAGMMNRFPCLVIRGICDYADSHKNDRWQPYASATAAAFGKELLSCVPARDRWAQSTKEAPADSKAQSSKLSPQSQDCLDASDYLSAFGFPTICFPTYPYHQAELADRLDNQDLDWFFESPEFEQWHRHDSEFLWLSGKPDSGKTVLSFCLWDHLRRNQTYNSREDIAIYFCSSALDTNQTPARLAAQILSTLISQLLRTDKDRLELVAQQCPLPKLSDTPAPFFPSQSLLDNLWKMLSTSVIALPSRQVIIIIDGIDALPTEEARRRFLRNLLQLRAEVRSKGAAGFKIFVTSRPFWEFKEELSGIPSIEKDKEKQQCLQSLKFNEFNARRDRVEAAHPQTGQWLANDFGYGNWNRSKYSSLLVIRGKPGSGKSTLAKSILNSKKLRYGFTLCSGEEVEKAGKDVLIADFFYSFRGGKKETSHTLMLQSLLYQLLSQDDRLFPLFRDVYRAQRSNPDFKWQYKDLSNIFASLPSLKTRQKIYIFLDAMDESTEQGRSEILSLLSELCSAGSDCTFKCLITSRPLPRGEIDKVLSYGHVIILQERNRIDIENVITSGLREIESLLGGPSVDLRFVGDYMMQHAEGVFLWVALVLRELTELASAGFSLEDLEICIKELPLELGDMYSLIIRRLLDQPKPPFRDMIEKGGKMLTWATFAERPLKTQEFCDAVAIPSISKPFNPDPKFLARTRIRGLELRIRACCGPLLEIRQSVVQLLHLTVREFLLRDDKSAEPFDTDEERGDTEIASCCIRYLRLLSLWISAKEIESWEATDFDEFVKWLADYPLLDYVGTFLPRHIKSLTERSPVYDELTLFLQGMRKDRAVFCLLESWVGVLGRPRTEDQQPGIAPGQFRVKCLITAARGGYAEVVKSAITLRTDMNGIDESGVFALHAAADRGHQEVVRLLLEMGVTVDTGDRDRRTALHMASRNGHAEVVRLLLDTDKVDPNAKDDDGRTPLLQAAANGHVAVVRLLLDTGIVHLDAEANMNDRLERRPLTYGYVEVARHYVAIPGDISTGTALQWAAENGHVAVVELLLEAGNVNPCAKGMYGRTPLSAAEIDRHDVVVPAKPLRKNSWAHADGYAEAEPAYADLYADLYAEGRPAYADLYAKEGLGQRLLRVAAANGHEAVVRLLLNAPRINPDAQDGLGRTPLQMAAGNGHVEVVKLLFDTGMADPDAKDRLGQTPLQRAAVNGHALTVKLLLDTGKVDPDAEDKVGRTALSRSTAVGHAAVIKLLLERDKVDVNAYQ